MSKSIEEMPLSEVMERLVKKHGLMEVVSAVNGHRYAEVCADADWQDPQAEERLKRK